MKINEKVLRHIIREVLEEYVVPMGYDLDSWLEKKKKEKISNKEYADETDGDKWKVVHGKTKPQRKGKGGRKLKSTKRGEPVNPSSKNLSYSKASKIHTAIELSERADGYENASKKNTHLDKPTSHDYMSGENKDWLGKGPVNKIIYDYLKSMGLIE